jgi:hypothetical protein
MADEPALASEPLSPSPGETAPSPSASPGEHAPSPGAEQSDKGETKESLLEAVQRAVPELRQSGKEEDADGGSGASPAQVADKDKAAASEDDPELPDEVTADELAKYGKTAKRRINKLTRQRERLQGEVQRLKAIEPSAQAADQVTNYLRTNDISRDDFLMTLELASAMRRGDFKTFYEGVRPYVKLAEEYLGYSLPPDLQQQVQQGHMTTQAAAMYSRERMDRAMAQTNAARSQQAFQQHQTASQTQAHAQAQQYLANQVKTTVDAWENRVAASDPDYAAKKAAVQDTMWAVVREQGIPQSTDHAVKIAEEALRRVNQRYQAWAPQRRPTSRTPSSTGRTAGVSPEPKTLLDVVKQARESARL